MQTPKTHHLHISTTTPSKTSSSPQMKMKSLIQNLLFTRICRLLRSLSKLKSFLAHLCQDVRVLYLQDSDSDLRRRKKRMNKIRQKILFGSFRLHYNWCSSSHVLPINYNYSSSTSPGEPNDAHLYYDSTWNSLFSTDDTKPFEADEAKNPSGGIKQGFEVDGSTQLSSYLQWLEEKGKTGIQEDEIAEKEMNEIDKLADLFIANCHEKFRLEKIESYRMYQEMLARSM